MPEVSIVKEAVIDILDTSGAPALSSTSDLPRIETKPDAQNEGAPPAELPAKAEAAEQQTESATVSTEEDSGQPTEEKKPSGVGKALAELRQQRKELEAQVEAEKQEKLRLLGLLERAEAALPKETKETDGEPVRPSKSDYSDPEAYSEAVMEYADAKASWAAKNEVEKYAAKTQKELETSQVQEVQRRMYDAYQAKVQTAKEKYPDFDQVMQATDVTVSRLIGDAIGRHENGPDIQYYFAKHPEEAKRISSLTVDIYDPSTRQTTEQPDVLKQLTELGRIVDRIAGGTPRASVSPSVSAAPRPIKPIAAGTEPSSKSPDEMSMEEYAAYKRQRDNLPDPMAPKANMRVRH